jgi:hypothetical protein
MLDILFKVIAVVAVFSLAIVIVILLPTKKDDKKSTNISYYDKQTKMALFLGDKFNWKRNLVFSIMVMIGLSILPIVPISGSGHSMGFIPPILIMYSIFIQFRLDVLLAIFIYIFGIFLITTMLSLMYIGVIKLFKKCLTSR